MLTFRIESDWLSFPAVSSHAKSTVNLFVASVGFHLVLCVTMCKRVIFAYAPNESLSPRLSAFRHSFA